MPSLFEINTRSWILGAGLTSIADVPATYWRTLRDYGVEYVWLMGVWQTAQSSISKYCFHPDLLREYTKANAAWKKADVGGSPYAIEDYHTSMLVGSDEDLLKARSDINEAGMKLVLDFVPNHFNADTPLIRTHPDIFFQRSAEEARQYGSTFYSTANGSFAHGRDPYFDPWTDTVQLNYFNPATQDFMLETLTQISKYCDGVRCDMAMLILPDIFDKTWSHLKTNSQQASNFWQKAIQTIKSSNPSFIFIAEAYWETEWRLQQDGFDYTYDKRLLDLLVHHDFDGLLNHLSADQAFQARMLRFIENHDETRSLSSLGSPASQAAASIIATIPGMTLYFDGQWEGARKKVPVQLVIPADEPNCPCPIGSELCLEEGPALCSCQSVHYHSILRAVNRDVFHKGDWKLINQPTLNGILAWSWTYESEVAIVFVNYSPEHRTGIIEIGHASDQIGTFLDILNRETKPSYFQHQDKGSWQIQLPPYKSSIISFGFKNQN